MQKANSLTLGFPQNERIISLSYNLKKKTYHYLCIKTFKKQLMTHFRDSNVFFSIMEEKYTYDFIPLSSITNL
jgi:hypothetical protein